MFFSYFCKSFASNILSQKANIRHGRGSFALRIEQSGGQRHRPTVQCTTLDYRRSGTIQRGKQRSRLPRTHREGPQVGLHAGPRQGDDLCQPGLAVNLSRPSGNGPKMSENGRGRVFLRGVENQVIAKNLSKSRKKLAELFGGEVKSPYLCTRF